jgi:uncharacterized protein YndB with AHSA1/START domain
MKTLTQTYFIETSPEEVYEALTKPEIMEEWSEGGPVVMELKPGGKFSLWGGDIHGTNLELVPNKKIKQEWYGGNWEQPSIVTFELVSAPDGTMVELLQENIPDESFAGIEEGWEAYYLGRIQELFAEDEEA